MPRQRMYSENVGGNWGLPAGYMETLTAPGRSYAAGISSMGNSIGDAIKQYHKNEEERSNAKSNFEMTLAPYAQDIESTGAVLGDKMLSKIQSGKATTGDYLAASNAIKTYEGRSDKERQWKALEDHRAFIERNAAAQLNIQKGNADINAGQFKLQVDNAAQTKQEQDRGAAVQAAAVRALNNANTAAIPAASVSTWQQTPLSLPNARREVENSLENGTPTGVSQDVINKFVSRGTVDAMNQLPPEELASVIGQYGKMARDLDPLAQAQWTDSLRPDDTRTFFPAQPSGITDKNAFKLQKPAAPSFAPISQDERFVVPKKYTERTPGRPFTHKEKQEKMVNQFAKTAKNPTVKEISDVQKLAEQMFPAEPVVEMRKLEGGFFQQFVDGVPRGVAIQFAASNNEFDKLSEPQQKAANDLRKELMGHKSVETYLQAEGYAESIKALTRQMADNTYKSSDDIALVFQYMKVLDPGSVVREGEYATAKNSGGIPDELRNTYNKAKDGTFLTPQQRVEFAKTAGIIVKGYLDQANKTVSEYRNQAENRGIPHKFVTPTFSGTGSAGSTGGNPPTLKYDPATKQFK